MGTDNCMGSVSIGVGGGAAVGGGTLSFGKTVESKDCNRRAYARDLRTAGQNEAALALLAKNPEVAEALEVTGFKAPWFKGPKAKKAEPVNAVPTFADHEAYLKTLAH